jgi:DNA-3-methyladenine glycosylase
VDVAPVRWRGDPAPDEAFPGDYFAADVRTVARALLGARLVSTVGGGTAAGVIVETEAYLGADDPASHAATRAGRTTRNAAMFGPPGRAYVYRIYGMHWCLNAVTGSVGHPQAVLLRGLEPLQGVDLMISRRGRSEDLASGPGRLCQALGIDGRIYGHDLGTPPLQVLPGWSVPDDDVVVTGRIGVREAADWPLRFCVRGSPGVSR